MEWDVFGGKYVSVVRRLLQLNLESVLPPPPKNVHFDAIFRLVSDRRIECRPCLSFFFYLFLFKLTRSVALGELYVLPFGFVAIGRCVRSQMDVNRFRQSAPSVIKLIVKWNLCSSASSNQVGTKRTWIECFESYRLVLIWIKFDEKWMRYFG